MPRNTYVLGHFCEYLFKQLEALFILLQDVSDGEDVSRFALDLVKVSSSAVVRSLTYSDHFKESDNTTQC